MRFVRLLRLLPWAWIATLFTRASDAKAQPRGMSRSLPLVRTLIVACFCIGAYAPALAELDSASPGEVIRLSPEAKAALLAQASEAKTDGLIGGGTARQVHGEVGAFVGTGGARGVFGTAAIPLGDTSGALISFESSRFGRLR
jgi:hypothetical protein